MLEYVLSFIAGKDKGREFPLPPDLELVIGRVSEVDLLLLDEKVSRKHAKISTKGGKVVLYDLNSQNGTFLNGQKVTTAELKKGDEIGIGSATLKLVPFNQPTGVAPVKRARARETAAPSKVFMAGSIQEVKLPDLLQLLSNSRKSGVLMIRSDPAVGKICLRNGHIYHASIEGSPAVRPYKALYRMFGWTKGTFELGPPEDRPVTEEITDRTTSLLLEGMRQLDEMHLLESRMPGPTARLTVPASPPGNLRDLATEELQIFQLVLHHGVLEAVVDHFPGTDLEAHTCVVGLLRRGFIVVS